MIIKAHWIVPISSPEIENGTVRVSKGIIRDIGSSKEIERKYANDRHIDLGNSVILPGFVNAHSHLAYTAIKGLLEKYSFLEWLRILSALKYEILNSNDFIISSIAGVLASIRNGITTVADSCDCIAPFTVARKFGLRMIFFFEVFGWETEQAITHLDNAISLLKNLAKIKTELQTIGLAPHAPYTVSPYFFNLIYAAFSQNPVPMSIHVAESPHEYELITQNKGKLIDFLALRGRSYTGKFTSILSYLDSTNILKIKPLLVHGIYLNEHDMQLLKKYALPIILCPTSNATFNHGIAPVSDFKVNNILWGLGTDSPASNSNMDLLQEMRLALRLQKNKIPDPVSLDEKELLEIATLRNAQILNLGNTTGSLEPGKEADIIALTLPYPNNKSYNDIYSIIVNRCVAANVSFTMIKGKIKYHNGNFVSINLPRNFDQKWHTVRNKIIDAIPLLSSRLGISLH